MEEEGAESIRTMEQKMLLSDGKIQEIFNSVVDHLNIYRKIPLATYRLQFNHQYKFSDAKSIVSYLHELGISDCYTSPYFKAKKGSLHGYDILDHNALNPEIGAEEEYNEFKDELENKVLIPVLGDQYGRVLEKQELTLVFEEGAFFIHYFERKFPVAPISYRKILEYHIDELKKKMGSDHLHLQELLSIITALIHLPPRTEKDQEKIVERRREKEIIKKRLGDLFNESEEVRSFCEENLKIFNA